VSLDNSITASWVGAPSKSSVVNLGDMLNGRMIVGIEVSERNFIDDFGEIAFKVRLGDGTSSVVLAIPGLGFVPSAGSAFKTAAQDCFACTLALTPDAPGTGKDTPFFTKLSARPDTVKFVAPPGLPFMSFILPQTTTEDHPDLPAHATAHFVRTIITDSGTFHVETSVPVDANSPFDFGQFSYLPVAEFYLDGFAGFPDGSLPIGLTFVDTPSGQDLVAIAGASRVVGVVIPPVNTPKRVNPKSHGKIVNRKSRGKLTVGTLSDASLDAPSQVDPSSLTFGHSGDEASLVGCVARAKDLNRDRVKDLVCKFNIRSSAFQPGDHLGVLKGRLFDGTRIGGSVEIVVPRPRVRRGSPPL
jgi:hypothetical protein